MFNFNDLATFHHSPFYRSVGLISPPFAHAVLLSGPIFINHLNEFHWSSFEAVIRSLLINYVCSQQGAVLVLANTQRECALCLTVCCCVLWECSYTVLCVIRPVNPIKEVCICKTTMCRDNSLT